MVVKLCQVDLLAAQGLPINEAVARVGLTLPTYRDWRKQVDRLKRDEFIRLRMLRAENAELERELTDLATRTAALREALRNVDAGGDRDSRRAAHAGRKVAVS
jgi:hypothetical protein